MRYSLFLCSRPTYTSTFSTIFFVPEDDRWHNTILRHFAISLFFFSFWYACFTNGLTCLLCICDTHHQILCLLCCTFIFPAQVMLLVPHVLLRGSRQASIALALRPVYKSSKLSELSQHAPNVWVQADSCTPSRSRSRLAYKCCLLLCAPCLSAAMSSTGAGDSLVTAPASFSIRLPGGSPRTHSA